MNLLAMSLVSAAALSFSSCSSNDDLGGGAGNQSKVESFYMTFAVQTPTSNGTRTQQPTDADFKVAGTPNETTITSGTFYLVNSQTNKTVFTKHITASELNNAAPESPVKGTTTTKIEVPVQNVDEGVTYTVYFLANTTDATPWTSVFAPTDDKFTEDNKFDAGYATADNFVMFNQNDKNSRANKYTVKFEAANKDISNAAQVSETIMLDRATARIDKPTSVAAINGEIPEGATKLQEKAINDAKDKVASITLSKYAITNLSNKTYIMQKWDDATWTSLQIPTDITYMQKAENLGGKYDLKNPEWFTDAAKNYVFENTADIPTTMYFEYTVKLDETKFTDDTPDCTDGTFYRYNGKIYRSIAAIYAAYKDQPILFGGKSAADLLGELKIKTEGETTVTKTIGATEEELKAFRQAYTIEVFREGKTYYSQVITDNWLKTNTIQRNTVYQLNVKNIYNVGADVPNGEPDENKPMYYLDVEVSVNPWVLNSQNVNLGE